jgi:hypothetical protein
MRSASNEYDYYTIFCSLLFPPPQSQVSSSPLHFQSPLNWVSFKDSHRVWRPCALTGSITVLIQSGAVRADTEFVLITLRNDMKTLAVSQNFSADTQIYQSLSGNMFVHRRQWVRHCLLQQFLSNRHSRPCLPEFVMHTCVGVAYDSTKEQWALLYAALYLPDRNLVFVMEAHCARLQVTEELPLSEGT